jgi:hypothetical protein
MAEVVSNVKIFRQSETNVRVLPSVCRFTTIVGAMLSLDLDGRERRAEIDTCLVGLVLKERSGQVEIQVRGSAVGAAAKVHILFSVTILAETPPLEA